MSALKDFGDTAKGLATNPLGIIALFIVLVYGIAALVLGLRGSGLTEHERVPLVWFLTLFPVVVLGIFAWLVSRHHQKLYGPRDYRDERHFVDSLRAEIRALPKANPNPVPRTTNTVLAEADNASLTTPSGRGHHRDRIYRENRGVFLTHVLAPSNQEGQEFDIFIYLIGHKGRDLSDVAKAEFFLGSYWGNEILLGSRSGNTLGIKTAAYGPFLCTCLVTFIDGGSCMLDRYIDFEMGYALRGGVESG